MTDSATFAAGCFWGIESAFRKLKGVVSTRVGYTGGNFENPTYKKICSGETGHAESVEVEFDTSEISYENLLNVFWNIHDPTTEDRQGPNAGSQYRSVIFYHSPEQKNAAILSKNRLQQTKKYRNKQIVTEIVPASEFYEAEDYHQQYLKKRGQCSCHVP